MDRESYVYILAGNKPHRGKAPLYVGSTNDLIERVWIHRSGQGGRHTARYRIGRLLWYEAHESSASAVRREYQIKKWRRSWKEELINEFNPEWRDLYPDLI